MNYIDLIIIFGYLLLTLFIGLHQGKKIKSIRDYTIADKQFSTSFIVATIAATWIGGGSTINAAGLGFSIGVIAIFSNFGFVIKKTIMAQYIAPRMHQFEDCLSVGEMVGKMYGKVGRVTTGLAGTLLCIGYVGAQIKGLGYTFEYFLGLPHMWGISIGMMVVILYATAGGVRAVTITDLIQFAILIIAIPMVFNVGLMKVGGYGALFSQLPDVNLSFTSNKEALQKFGLIFFIYCLPFLDPAVTQRMLMAKTVKQIQDSFRVSAMIDIPFYLIAGSMGLVALALNNTLEPNHSLFYLVDTILPIGLKGFAVAGILAVIMSTADSYLNVAGISIVHDVLSPLKNFQFSEKKTLSLMKISSFGVGVLSIIFAVSFKNIYEIVLYAHNFWAPVVMAPLLLGIFGFISSTRSFIVGATSGLTMFALWEISGLESILKVGSLLPSIIANASGFLLAHYLGKRPFSRLGLTLPTDPSFSSNCNNFRKKAS